tara:strand:- start:9 stop:713 length:705 start_codon:yes stop_codon:yes gene_type:complete
MSNNIQIAIAGGNGKMGTLLSELIESKDCFEISGIYDPRNKSDKYITWENYSDIEGDYLFVFVPANYLEGFVKNYVQYIDKVKKGIVIGSSGEFTSQIKHWWVDRHEKTVCVIPNFSIGAMYQKLVARKVKNDFKNIDITEKHHTKKADKPSGTSIDLVKSLNSQENIQINSIRSDDVLAEQIVSFKNEFEIFNTEHIVTDRKAYLTGLNLVLDKLESLNGYYHGLEKILNKRA